VRAPSRRPRPGERRGGHRDAVAPLPGRRRRGRVARALRRVSSVPDVVLRVRHHRRGSSRRGPRDSRVRRRGGMMTNANLAALSAAGVSVWLDDLSRQLITSGGLAQRMSTYSVVGVTTNPAIFQSALADSSAYESALTEAVRESRDVDSVVRALTTADVRDACDVLAGVYEATDGVDGRVSLEVDPRLADDTARTITQAVELSEAVDRPNVMIKIPATAAGLPAITEVVGKGIDVNVTLIFSVDQYRRVAESYLDGLERAAADGLDLSTIHSVASVFVSRLDTEIDSRLAEGSELRGAAGVANARLCHEVFNEVFDPAGRFGALAERGARPQRLLWASTGVKDPAYPDTMYVTGLVTHG